MLHKSIQIIIVMSTRDMHMIKNSQCFVSMYMFDKCFKQNDNMAT